MKPEIVEELARAIARHMTDDPDAKAIICDQKLAQALAPFIDRLVSEAREATEAAIVAWLREPDTREAEYYLHAAADRIEAGAYRQPPDT